VITNSLALRSSVMMNSPSRAPLTLMCAGCSFVRNHGRPSGDDRLILRFDHCMGEGSPARYKTNWVPSVPLQEPSIDRPSVLGATG
jgi:hypothetical protein